MTDFASGGRYGTRTYDLVRVKQPRLWTVLDSDGIPAETIDLARTVVDWRGPESATKLPPKFGARLPAADVRWLESTAPMLYLHVVASLRETPELMSTILRCLAEPVPRRKAYS